MHILTAKDVSYPILTQVSQGLLNEFYNVTYRKLLKSVILYSIPNFHTLEADVPNHSMLLSACVYLLSKISLHLVWYTPPILVPPVLPSHEIAPNPP